MQCSEPYTWLSPSYPGQSGEVFSVSVFLWSMRWSASPLFRCTTPLRLTPLSPRALTGFRTQGLALLVSPGAAWLACPDVPARQRMAPPTAPPSLVTRIQVKNISMPHSFLSHHEFIDHRPTSSSVLIKTQVSVLGVDRD